MGFWFRFGNLKIRFSLWDILFVLGRSHVLWCTGMGPLAYCCSNCLSTMYVLYHTWIALNRSCWHSRFSVEPCVFLWLCYRYYLYRYWLVRLCFISAQLSCRVIVLFHLSHRTSSFVNVVLLLEFVIGNHYSSNHDSRVLTFWEEFVYLQFVWAYQIFKLFTYLQFVWAYHMT